jgi:hypothetical protein
MPALLLFGCGKEVLPPESCSPLSVVDGYVTVKVKTLEGDLTLRLPEYTHIVREPTRGCQYVNHASIDYLWYEGKLISGTSNRFKVPADKHMKVMLGLNVNGPHMSVANMPKPPESWRYEHALRHKTFPLEFYPRWRWDGPESVSAGSLMDNAWGITGTRHKDPRNDKPFGAFCSIPPVDTSRSDSRVEGAFAKFGDSKCRGWLLATKNGKVLGALIDVWAPGAQEISYIYDAAVEQLQKFIQE